jgi:uncharacterized metal-binding protein/predicted Fe-Mo cluster-binding NifX family protein
MRYAIPLLEDRVAPRCTFADSILLVTAARHRILERSVVPLEGTAWTDLARVLSDHRVDTMVCGGISPATRESIRAGAVTIIENVAGSSAEILDALEQGTLRPGFGLSRGEDRPPPAARAAAGNGAVDCLACRDRVCLRGRACPALDPQRSRRLAPPDEQMLASAMDVACESERSLCRLAELVYFALGMNYRRIGLAFCLDLLEPATVLADVLRRFFDVFPVCCKVGGIPLDEAGTAGGDGCATACDPAGQAALLNALNTDLNVIVGLCVGVDCVFARDSVAPVTTIFVKDKSLANNPIGAVYSHYHLKDI